MNRASRPNASHELVVLPRRHFSACGYHVYHGSNVPLTMTQQLNPTFPFVTMIQFDARQRDADSPSSARATTVYCTGSHRRGALHSFRTNNCRVRCHETGGGCSTLMAVSPRSASYAFCLRLQITKFLNEFEVSVRYKLSTLAERVGSLERHLEYCETASKRKEDLQRFNSTPVDG